MRFVRWIVRHIVHAFRLYRWTWMLLRDTYPIVKGVLLYGTRKYGWGDAWLYESVESHLSHASRHIQEFLQDQDNVRHLHHAVVRVLMAVVVFVGRHEQ